MEGKYKGHQVQPADHLRANQNFKYSIVGIVQQPRGTEGFARKPDPCLSTHAGKNA